MCRIVATFGALLGSIALLTAHPVGPALAADDAEQSTDGITVQQDEAQSQTIITIPIVDGKVAWSQVVRAITRAKQLDDAALDGVLPKGSFDVRSFASRITLLAVNRGLKPNIQLRILGLGTEQERLQITMDHEAITASRQRFRQMRKRGRTGGEPGRTYGLEFDEDWAETAESKELVVVVHGYNSTPERIDVVRQPARDAGLPSAALRYPNDQSLSRSAQLLSAELKKLAAEHPRRRVALVSHSMGGLIARECIETEALNPGNVSRLIMVASPNAGTRLATFAIGADLYERLVERRSAADVSRRLIDFSRDGLNEARHDLEPESAYLKRMNGLKRNPDVRYSILLGTSAPATREKLDEIREALRSAAEQQRFVQLVAPKLDGWLADMDEVVDGQGDGVVALKRGRLAGVDDTVLLPFNHLMTGPEADGIRQLQAAIRERLESRDVGVSGAVE